MCMCVSSGVFTTLLLSLLRVIYWRENLLIYPAAQGMTHTLVHTFAYAEDYGRAMKTIEFLNQYVVCQYCVHSHFFKWGNTIIYLCTDPTDSICVFSISLFQTLLPYHLHNKTSNALYILIFDSFIFYFVYSSSFVFLQKSRRLTYIYMQKQVLL